MNINSFTFELMVEQSLFVGCSKRFSNLAPASHLVLEVGRGTNDSVCVAFRYPGVVKFPLTGMFPVAISK